jgi:hypothetical protein
MLLALVGRYPMTDVLVFGTLCLVGLIYNTRRGGERRQDLQRVTGERLVLKFIGDQYRAGRPGYGPGI